MKLPKTLSFKDLMTVNYMPGQDPLISRNAKKRKGNETETSGPSESVAKAGLDENADTYQRRMSDHYAANDAYHRKPSSVLKVDPKTGKRVWAATGKPFDEHEPSVKEEIEVSETVLNAQQRRAKSILMKRLAPKMKLGRDRASRRFADMDRLKHRAQKAARTAIFKKLTKGIPKDELTYARRADIEKRLDSPAMKARIERIAIKMLPKERQMEVDRHRQPSSEEK